MTSDDETLAALEQVYDGGYHRFFRVAEAITRDRELARDCVQEAFARAVRGRAGYRREGDLEAWVWRIVVNTARDGASGRVMPVVTPADQDDLATSNGHVAERDLLRPLVAALPERQRLVLFLRYYADLEYASIARVLGIETGTVGATLNQAHAALRRALEEVPR